MPDVFRSPLDAPDATSASYLGVIAKDVKPLIAGLETEDAAAPQGRFYEGLVVPKGMCFLWPSHGSRGCDIVDGTAHTIALVEAKRDVPWTKPEDITYDAKKPLPEFGGWFESGFFAGFGNGMVKFVLADNDERTIRNLLTINDGQRVDPRAIGTIPTDDPLEFRFLPNHVDAGRAPSLSDDEFERYRQQLAKGDLARPWHGDEYCWREIEPSIRAPFTLEEGDRSYVLTSYLDNTLLWGELQGHVSAVGGGGETGLPEGMSSLDIEFDDEVGAKLRRLTRANLHSQLAIVVCGKVIMAPTIRDEIGSSVKITGAFSNDELTRVLKALQGAAETGGERDGQDAAAEGQAATPVADREAAANPRSTDKLHLAVNGPTTAHVGQKVKFEIELKNDGPEDQAAQVSIAYAACLFPRQATPGFAIENDTLNWRIDSLPAGGGISHSVAFECTAPHRNAELRCTVVLPDKSELTAKARITIDESDVPVRLKTEPDPDAVERSRD